MSKANIKLLCVLFLSIFLVSLVSAQPPFQQPSQTTPIEAGYLVIETGFPEYHKAGEDFYIHTHVYNGSDGLLLTEGINCYYHFYDHQINGGEHIDQGVLTLYGDGYYNYTNGSLLTTVGLYSVLIWCNSTEQGGFTKYAFQITPTGLALQSGTSGIYIAILFLLVIFLVLSIMSFARFDNLLNRVGMIGLSYLLLIAITFIGWNMANDFITSAPFLISMLRILFFVLIIGVFPMVIGGFAWYFLMLWRIKEIQRLMDKGMDQNEAEHRVKRRRR